jgi:hypothetical protein
MWCMHGAHTLRSAYNAREVRVGHRLALFGVYQMKLVYFHASTTCTLYGTGMSVRALPYWYPVNCRITPST